MKNIFNKSKSLAGTVNPAPKELSFWDNLKKEFTSPPMAIQNQSEREVIQEIHDTFYTEVDRILSEAKISKSLDTDKQHLIDKCKRLKALGFTSTQEVREAEAEITRLDLIKKENEAKKKIVKAVNYFTEKYPNYKFITEESVIKICDKYNLYHGPINKYIGTVPDVNLKHIEDFTVFENDKCFKYEKRFMPTLQPYYSFDNEDWNLSERKMISLEEHIAKKKDIMYNKDGYEINERCPLEIAAPLKDFNMTGMETKGRKISKVEILDPIVLHPVFFAGSKHYLIVTAWGLEASNELIVNQRFN